MRRLKFSFLKQIFHHHRSVYALAQNVNKNPPSLEVAVNNMRTSASLLICSLLLRLVSLVEACIPSLGPPTNGGKTKI